MRIFAAISVLLLLATSVVVSCQNRDSALRAAIAGAVKARLGAGAEVIVGSVQIFTRDPDACRGGAECQVTPDPAARLGHTIRFTLSAVRHDGPAVRFERIGVAEAGVTVSAAVPRATAVIRRGDALSPANVDAAAETLSDVPLRRLPDLNDVIGARAVRDIAPGERLAAGMILIPPAIRTGQHVTAYSRVDGIEVSASLMAAESGVSGDIIRLVNPDSRKSLRARILSPSRVEVIHE